MSNEPIYSTENDPLGDLVAKPEKAIAFGPDAWVYSEMLARHMVATAYQRGKQESSKISER